MKKKRFEGVIFDLDGTLLDTIADIIISSPDARADFMISSRVSTTSFAMVGLRLFFCESVSMIVFLVQDNLSFLPSG